MTKKKAAKEKEVPENKLENTIDPFIGGEEDDLSEMEYIQDETTTTRVETQPPETKEEADAIAEIEAAQEKAEKALEEGEKIADEVKAEEKEDNDGKTPESDPKDEAKTEPEEKTEETVVLEDDKRIPKDRFDEVNDRMKKAEEDNKSLRKQLEHTIEEKKEPEPDPFDYETKETEAMDALLEGDSKKYGELRKEIRTAERAETLREAKKLAEQGDTDLRDTLTFEEAGERVEADYPQYVEGSESYNAEAREEMLDLYIGYARSGNYTKVQALQKAATQAAKIHDLKATSDVTEDSKPNNVVDIKKTDVAAKAKVDEAQPPAMEARADGAHEEPRTDVMSMSDEEFEAMPESTKRRMRGDIL